MSTEGENTAAGAVRTHELAHKQSEWWWFLLLGIALIILGRWRSVCRSCLGRLSSYSGSYCWWRYCPDRQRFWEGEWSGLLLHLLMGILYAVVGGLIIGNPLEGMAG